MAGDLTSGGLLVVLMGASEWPHWPTLNNPAFRQSYVQFRSYVCDVLAVAAEDVLDLFDDGESPAALVRRIQDFLDQRAASASDLLFYYVGHADHVDKKFAVFTACASQDQMLSSSFSVQYIAEATREAGRRMRISIVLDACFSASATAAFDQPVGSAGVAILASSSAGDMSTVPEGAALTILTDALLSALAHGDPDAGRRLSLRQLDGMLQDELAARFPQIDVRPELHSPHRRQGDPASVGLFPNPAFAYASPAPVDARRDANSWCAVVSEADVAEGAFVDAMMGIKDRYRAHIEDATSWDLAEKPTIVWAADVFRNPRSMQEAVAQVCSANLVFFDLTGLEPAALVLLGVRAVIRRGVTVCHMTADAAGDWGATPPFLLRDVNVAIATKASEHILGPRALRGIRELMRSPHRYTDLPGFEVIRQMPPLLTGRTLVPYDEGVLVLCSFDSTYTKRNWLELENKLAGAIERQSLGHGGKDRVRIQRTLDMGSPRMVSTSLLEAIRFTDLCVCDLTGWRPNVLFELGVRLAAHALDPVCIVDAAEALTGPQAGPQGQRQGLRSIFRVVEYHPDKREDYYRMVDRHLRDREAALAKPRTWSGDELPVGGIYRVAWQYAESRHESAAVDVVDLLRDSAEELRTDRTRGSSPFIFPVGHAMTAEARVNARERLVAAWLYLRYRGALARRDAFSGDAASEVAIVLANLLEDADDEADIKLRDEVDAFLAGDDAVAEGSGGS